MQQPQAPSPAEIPRLIAELREHWVRKTGKPIDPDVDFLTTQIEVLSAAQPEPFRPSDDYDFTPMERRIFNTLAKQSGRTFSRDALLNAMYYDHIDGGKEAKILDVYLWRIRNKLVAHDAPCWVETVYGLGFRIVIKPARDCRA